MPVRDKVYEKMKSFGLTDSKEDFYKYYDSDENVRKDVFRRLQEDGLTDTEEEFYSYMQPTVVKNEESDPFDTNVERAKNGEPIQRVSTQSMINAHPELGLKNIPNLPTLKEQVEKSNVRDGKLVFGKPGFNGNEVSALYPMSSETLSNRLSDPRILDKDMSIRSVNEADEEKKIDAFFHSKPMKTAKDVYDNYSARFSNTERGIELGEELSDISRTITDKYANEYFNSDSYKELAKRYQGEELAKKANEEFQKTYGYTIDKELKPYQDAYNNELSIRYGSNMDEALRSIAKESVSGKLNSLTGEVESMLKDSEEKLQQHRSTSGKGLNAIMGNQQYLNDTKSQRKERNMLESARELLDDSQNIVNEASKKGNTTFIEGLARGFWDNLNAEDFTFGLAELADMKYLNEALKKAEQGEQLTPAEEKLLEASTINMATQAYFSSDLGRGYKAGSVTAESIPFMLEFIANPISGSGNAIAKGLLKFGLKRFGKSMTSKTAKAVGRLIGDATAAVGMTSTTGMPSVLAETYNRLNRNYKYGVGEDGELYVNKEGDTSFGEAFGKSFTTRAIENQSEMIFHAFKGAGNLLKGVDATLPGGVNTFFDYIKNSKVGELWRVIKNSPLRKELAEATKVGGIGEEYLEEVYNNFANVALGEMSMEEALNLDNNIDTFLGLAPTQVMFSMLGLGNMAALRYKTRRDIEDLRATMNESQRQALDGLLAMGTTATNQDVHEFIRNTMANQSLSIDEKRNAVKAAYDVARQKAMADVQEAEVEDKIAEENADIDAKTDPQTGNYGEVTLLGMDESGEPTANPANVFGAKVVDGELYLLVLPEGETEKKWVRPHEYDAESHQIMPGAEVKAYNEQMIREEAAKQAEQEAKYAPDVLNAQMQQGIPFEDETAVYVPFQVTPEGNAWQVEVYNKDENGKPSKDASGVNVITNDQFRDILQTEYDRKEMQKPETEEPKQRGTVSTPVALAYLLEGGQNSIENLGYFLHGVAAAFPELENEIETIRGNIGEGLGVSPDKFAEVAPREMAEMRQVIESKYGKEGSTIFDELVANSTGYVPKVGAEMALRLENLKPIQNEGQQPAQEAAPATEAENVSEVGQPISAQEGTVGNIPAQNNEIGGPLSDNIQQQAPVIPTKEDGSIDFVSYGKDNTFKTLGEKYGEKMPNKVAVTAKAFAEDLVKAQEKLVKAEEAYDNAPIGREQKAEQARDKAKAELESIQREADFWSSLDNEIKEAQAKRDALLNPKADIDMSDEPMNADEFIAQQLANGNIALESASYKKETGYGEKERQKFIKMFRKAENGGMSIESAGDLLMQMDRENGTNFFDPNDANAGRDALINFLGSVSSWGDVTGYIRNNREAQAAKETEGLRNEIEDAIEANYHMTPEEYATLQEMEATENPFEGVDIEAKDAIFAEAALEYEEYLKSLENGQGTTEEVIEGNGDVLSEEQSDNSGGTEQRQGEGLDVSEGTVQSDDAAQEESAEVEEGNTPFRQTESILEQAERIANEEARRKPLRQRAKEWEQKLGVKVNIIENFDDVTNKDAKRAIRNGQRVTGWYEESTGEVCLYMPYLESAQEIDATYIHEVVAHKGLRGLLGDKFDEFLDDVWSAMSEADKLIYLTYPGVNGNKRAAADEYIAHLAENIDVTESAWGKLAELIKKFLKAIGLEPKMTHADIANTIKLSYQRLLSGEGGKERIQDLINQQQTNLADVDYLELDSIANIINDFQNPTLPEEKTLFKVVYHGSGSSFDKFDHSFMGTGEGAQAYGWGTYVTEVDGIARTYGNQMRAKKDSVIKYKGDVIDLDKKLPDAVRSVVNLMQISDYTPEDALKYLVANYQKDVDYYESQINEQKDKINLLQQGIDILNGITDEEFNSWKKEHLFGELTNGLKYKERERLARIWGDGFYSRERAINNSVELMEYIPSEIDNINKNYKAAKAKVSKYTELNPGDFEIEKPKAHLYTVDIPDENEGVYLDYVEPMTKQGELHKLIEEGLREIGWDHQDVDGRAVFTNGGKKIVLNPYQSGADLYEELTDALGSKKSASEFLGGIGFTGIVYPAEFRSGGRSDGSKNYVIFNEKDLDIKEHTRFRVLNDKNGRKSLVGLHNISENKLRKAIKQGGLANPSVAVIDMDKQSHTDYGDITLVLPASMIDKKTGKNVGTYLADAYTPVYPTVVKKMSDKGAKALTKALESVDEIFRSKVRTYFNSYLDSGTIYDALAYWYLSDTEKNPPILEAALPEGFTKEEVEKVKSINSEADSFFQLSEDEKQKALNLYADKFFGGMKEYENHLSDYTKRMQEVVKDESKPQMVRKNIQQNLNAIERYGYEYDRVAGYYNRAVFLADRQSKPSEIETFRNAFDEVSKNGLEEDFGNWLMAKEDEFGVEEKLFAGYDNQGRAKYLPNTLENASKLMKKEGRAGATGLGGFNYFVAILAPVAKTTKQISAKKGNLSTQEEYDKFVEEWKDYYHDLARQLQPGAGKWDDYGYHRLHEIAPMANPKAYVKKEYGIDLSDEFLKDLNDVKNAIKNDFPARYFETKFERPVYLNEVAAAVVPSDMSLDLYGQLQRMGIPMYEYENGNNEARMEAIDKVTIDNDGIRFRTLPSMKLRKLEEGEKCNVERVFTQQKMFNFSSGEKIESYEDVAYIFKSLEDEAIENTFVALIKDGKPTIVHLGMGTANQSTLDQQAVIVAIDRIKPDEVYMVHNHPSGNLKASRQDVVLLDSMKKAYGQIVKDGIIINLRSGRYSVFNEEGSYAESNASIPSKEIPVKTYSFSKRVFDKDFDIQELINVRSADDANYYAEKHGLVAALTSSQRLGDRDKISLLVIDQSGKIVGNVFLNHTDVTPSNMTSISKDIAYYTSAMSGQFAIIFGRMNIKEAGYLNMVVQRVSAGSVKMYDAISVNKDGGYVSAANEGVMEEAVDYANNDTRFRIAPQEEVQAEVDKFTSKYNGKEVVVLNSTVSDEELESLGLDVEDVREAIEKETEGFYDPITDKIYIFADIADADELEKTLFHENGHGIFRKNKKFVNEFNENSKDKFKKGREDIAKYYKEHERAEELFVRIFDQELTSGNFEYLPKYLSEELWNEFNDILKDFGYDRQEESDRRRKGSVVRTETDRGSEKEADVRNSDIEPNQREERKEKGRSKEQAERLKKLFDDVADMGLRGVLGNTNYDLAMLDIFYALPEKERTDVAVRAVKIGGDVAVAVDEYLKDAKEPTLWQKVVAAVSNALRKIGIDVQLTENDVKYLLWRSRKPLDRNSIFDMAEDIDMKRKLNVGKFDNDPTDGGDTPGGGIRFRVSNKLQIRDEYESTIKKGGYQAREAVQDAMLSLRRTQELIEKASGKKLRGFENAWEHENRLSSVVQAEIHEMERKFYKPMMDAVKKLAEAMGGKNDYAVADYLMLKHGIERNREMAVRKALTDTEGKIDRTQLEQWYKDKDAIRNDANLPTWREKQEAMDNAALNYGADMSVDYSGLTSMFGSDDLADCTDKAYKEVESLEKKYPSETKALGKAVKALNQSTIDKSFESGLMDRKVRDELKNDMYDYYVPLRGFDEVTSDEVYSYLDNDRNAFNAPLRRAKGRTSKADNPIAYMKSIAESGIMQGERNKMKQSFLNMVTNHPSDLISVREGVWVVLNPATGEWEAASMPTIPNNATPADVESILEAWEANMEKQAATKPNIKKISEGADIPYRVIGNRMEQHQVIVKRNGKSYTLTVNGNPRLAMALNGLTNPNNTSKDGRVAADIQKAVDKMNRTLAAWYTTRNPDFVASNFMRDTFYTNTIVRAKEGNKYANKFHKHYIKLLMPGKMLSLFNKYENGKLDMNNKTEKAFYDFIMNGGETGYSNLKDIEHIKNEIANQLKGDRLKWFRQVSDKLDLVNRAVENTSRFAAFLTSREMGRDMSKSIFDAKEISVNFNKKGAGGTFYKGTGQTKFGNLAAMVGAGGRGLYVFFNAAIQGSTNLLHVMKVNPKGTSAGLAAMFLMGAVLPYLLSGDDDKDYYDLPEHVRRNHLVLPGAGDTWVSIPLPIEYRIMYGMGELFTSWRTGHERGSNVALKALSLTGQALPLNFLEEGLDAFVPSALSPLWQAYNNRSWTGLPIYKDNEFNKDDPEYTKAYKNVDRLIYNFTKSLYDWTFDEENQEAGIDLNPAVIESLARGYFGGLFTQMSNIVKTAETIGGDREFDWRNIPIGNRIFKSGDEQTKEKRITNEYFNNMEKLDFLESRRRMLNRTIDGKAVPEEDVEKAKADLEQMIQTGVYQKYMKFKEYKKVADKIRKAMKDNGSTEELQRKLSEAQEKANEVLR